MPTRKKNGDTTRNGVPLKDTIDVESPPPGIQTGADVPATHMSEDTDTENWPECPQEKTMIDMLTSIRMLATEIETTNMELKQKLLNEVNQAIMRVRKEEKEREDNGQAGIERGIAEIKAILTARPMPQLTNDARTWAEIASTPPAAPHALEAFRREQQERLRRQREKTEVLVSLKSATDTKVLKQLEEQPEQALIKTIQESANQWLHARGKPRIQIIGIRKLTKRIKIACSTPEEATLLRELNWETVLGGASLVISTFGVLIHGAAKKDIANANQEAIEELEIMNNVPPGSIAHIKPLLRKPKNAEAPTQSYIVAFKCPKTANQIIQRGMHVGHRHHYPERYIPQSQITQCFKCQGYGHKAEVCTKVLRCGKCAQEHGTKECTSAETKCAQCNGSHHSWHRDCPKRAREQERLRVIRATTPLTFETE